MKKLLLALLLISCGTSSQLLLHTNTYYNKNFSLELVDSILKSERIESLESIPLKGSLGYFYEYYYLKDSLVLRLIKNGDSIKVTKRINQQ